MEFCKFVKEAVGVVMLTLTPRMRDTSILEGYRQWCCSSSFWSADNYQTRCVSVETLTLDAALLDYAKPEGYR